MANNLKKKEDQTRLRIGQKKGQGSSNGISGKGSKGDDSVLKYGAIIDSDEIADHMGRNNIPYTMLMRDQIVDIKPSHPYILNLDTSHGTGTHWTTFMLKRRTIHYFDSYGMPPPQELVDYARDHKQSIKWNDVQFQDDKSVACGYFAMYVAQSMIKNKYPQSLSVFSENLKKNDDVVHSMF